MVLLEEGEDLFDEFGNYIGPVPEDDGGMGAEHDGVYNGEESMADGREDGDLNEQFAMVSMDTDGTT